jgi:hypothetical protein
MTQRVDVADRCHSGGERLKDRQPAICDPWTCSVRMGLICTIRLARWMGWTRREDSNLWTEDSCRRLHLCGVPMQNANSASMRSSHFLPLHLIHHLLLSSGEPGKEREIIFLEVGNWDKSPKQDRCVGTPRSTMASSGAPLSAITNHAALPRQAHRIAVP